MEYNHKITAGTVVYKDNKRLAEWVNRWADMADRLIVLDQTRYQIPSEVPNVSNLEHVPVTPNGNPDMHWNSLMFSASEGYLLRLGSDEFMDEEMFEAMRQEIDQYPHVVLWFIRRRNWIDGIDRSDIFACGDDFRGGDPEGYDWQPALVKLDVNNQPLPVVYSVHMHTAPQVMCPNELVAFMDPKRFWIDHQRTSEMVKDANAKRNTFLNDKGRHLQSRFIQAMEVGK